MAAENNAFLSIRNRHDLAKFLDIPLSFLTMFAYKDEDFYRHFSIPKRNGSFRKIDAPTGRLLTIQRRISDALYSVYDPPVCVHGFVYDKSIATNARAHSGHAAILNIDLKDFFPSITSNRVHGLFACDLFNLDDEAVNLVTDLLCSGGCLPQGAPTSPVISNMICRSMDIRLTKYCDTHHLFYTRYADDICISSISKRKMLCAYNPETNEINPKIRNIIEKSGFVINEDKVHMSYKTERCTVNRIVVNSKCNLPREEYRALRVLFHNWKSKGWEFAARAYVAHEGSRMRRLKYSFIDDYGNLSEEKFKSHIRGRLDFYTMVDRQNKQPSTSVIRLWDMYREVVKEPIPYAFPKDMIYGTEAAFDAKNRDGLDLTVCASGTCFLTDSGLMVTCRHCLVGDFKDLELNNDSILSVSPDSSSTVEIDVSKFELDWDMDLAYSEAPELFTNLPGFKLNFDYLPQINEVVYAFGYADGDKELHFINNAKIDSFSRDKHRIYVDRPFIAGMSGGPVLNRRGEVIGYIVEGSKRNEYFYNGAFVLLRSIRDSRFAKYVKKQG